MADRPESANPNSAAGADRVDPGALSVEQIARLLTAAGGKTVSERTVRAHIEAGAPVSAEGRLNLVHYVAWLVREVARGQA